MHEDARWRSQDLGTIGYDGTYMHATVKMDSDSSPVSIDTEEIEQSTQSASLRQEAEREIVEAKREEATTETTDNNDSGLLRQGERYRLTVQHEWPEQRQQRLQT